MCINNSFINNNLNVNTNIQQVNMDTLIMVYFCNGILQSNKKNILLIHAFTWINFTVIMLGKCLMQKIYAVLFHYTKFKSRQN